MPILHIIIRNFQRSGIFQSVTWIFKGRDYVTPGKNILYHTGSSVRLPSCRENICHVVTAFSLLRAWTASNQYHGLCYSFWVFEKSIFNNIFRAEPHKEGLESPPTFLHPAKEKYIIRRDDISVIGSLGPEVWRNPTLVQAWTQSHKCGIKHQLWMPTKAQSSKTCSGNFWL